MGFVGGSSNIAIVTALPFLNFVLYCVQIFISLWFLDIYFLCCPGTSVSGLETNPGPQPSASCSWACRILCSNVRGLSKSLSDVTVASSQCDLLLCSATLVSDRCHISELLVPGFGRPVLLCQDGVPRAHGMAAYVQDGYGAFSQPKFEHGCCVMLVFRVCAARQNFYVFSLYRNPDLDDQIIETNEDFTELKQFMI